MQPKINENHKETVDAGLNVPCVPAAKVIQLLESSSFRIHLAGALRDNRKIPIAKAPHISRELTRELSQAFANSAQLGHNFALSELRTIARSHLKKHPACTTAITSLLSKHRSTPKPQKHSRRPKISKPLVLFISTALANLAKYAYTALTIIIFPLKKINLKNNKSSKPHAEKRNRQEEKTNIAIGATRTVITSILEALSLTSVVINTGETLKISSTRRSLHWVDLKISESDFLNEKLIAELLPQLESVPRGVLRTHLHRVSQLPKPPLHSSVKKEKDRKAIHAKLQKTLLMLLKKEDIDIPALKKTVEFFQRLFQTSDLCFYFSPFPQVIDYAQTVDIIYNACRKGSIRLNFVSCPNYSGKEIEDEHGNKTWSYDFVSLGNNVGVVALKGIPYIKALNQIFESLEISTELIHFQPSFEIDPAVGFVSADNSPNHNIPYNEAIKRLQSSNEKIKELYNAEGLDVRVTLTSELLSDTTFAEREKELGRKLQEQRLEDKKLDGFLKFIFHSRREIYTNWYPPDNETDEEHQERLLNEVIPLNVARYVLAGQLFSEQEALFPSYDSLVMSEIYSYFKIPCLVGQSSSALDYVN